MLGWLLDDLRKEREGGGGGGRARIRLGNTGPRGRLYAVKAVAKNRINCIVKARYVKTSMDAGRHIMAHLRYIEERERGVDEKERDFFDRNRDGIERKEVQRVMLENTGDRVAMQKLMLSPGDNRVNIREYTRDSMEALEKRMGYELDWYGVTHENTDHHHAHVVIAGKIPGYERRLEQREALKEDRWMGELVDRVEREDRLYDLLEGKEPKDLDREEIDPRVAELLGEQRRSAEELRFEKFLDKYEREMAMREETKAKGEVYLDRGDLAELKHAGNDYLLRERSMDRAIERAMEREREFDRSPERGHERQMELNLETSRWSDIANAFDTDRYLQKETERTFEKPERTKERDDDLDRGDFDRGR